MTAIISDPTDSKEWPQILALFIVSLSMLNYGLLYAWTSPSISILTDKDHPLGISSEDASYFTVLPPIATIIVALPLYLLVDKIGRRFTLLVGLIPYCISWILIAIGNSVWVFYASRFISGIGDACAICATSMYVGEVSVPKVRGKWGNLLVLTLFLGILFMNLVGGYLDIATTAYIFVTIPVINFVLLYFMPESPYFLLMKDKDIEAKTALKWLRKSDNVDEEFNAISEAVKRQMKESGTFKDLFVIDSNRKALIAVLIIRVAQQFSGMSAFIVYSQTIFQIAGGDDFTLSSLDSAMICSCVQLVFAVIGSVIVDKFGRRITLFNSAIGSIIVLILMTVYFYLDTNTDIEVSDINWFPVVGMIVYLIFFSLGLSIVPTLMCGELFSSSVKGKAMAINNIIFAACIGSTTKIFQVLTEFGLYAPFLFYAISCGIATVICFFVVPETKGKTLDEIQLAFKDKKHDGNEQEHVC